MKPTAAPFSFPYPHASLAKVWQREALREFNRLPPEYRRGRTVRQFVEGV